jgi:hypothetical protein
VIPGVVCYCHHELDIAIIALDGRSRSNHHAPLLAPSQHTHLYTTPSAIVYGFPQRSDLARLSATTSSGKVELIATPGSGPVLLKASCPGLSTWKGHWVYACVYMRDCHMMLTCSISRHERRGTDHRWATIWHCIIVRRGTHGTKTFGVRLCHICRELSGMRSGRLPASSRLLLCCTYRADIPLVTNFDQECQDGCPKTMVLSHNER